jgi:HK97 family phage major capsid protein
MSIKELQDKRNKLMQDAQKLLKNPTAETRTMFDAQMADVDLLEADIERAERSAKFDAEQRSAGRPPRSQPGFTATDTNEQAAGEHRALEQYIRYGAVSEENRSFIRTAGIEQRDLGTGAVAGNISGGSQLIAQSFYPLLTQAQKSWGALTTILNVKKTDTGSPMKVALENDTTNILAVIGESVATSEADPTLTGITSSTDFCSTGVVKVSLAELQDSAFSLDQFIRDAFGKRYWSVGSSSGNVQSIVTSATLGATSAAPTVISYADLLAVFAANDPAYIENASWVFNSTTRAVLMGVVDTLGRPLFQPSPNAGAFDTLLGRPVVLNQFQPSIAATNRAVLFGDFSSGYTFRQVQGDLSILRLNERYADTGEVGFIGYARIGGFATDAGTHPIVALQQHA